MHRQEHWCGEAPPSSRSPEGTVDRYCLVCGGIHTASLTWCCGKHRGYQTVASFRKALKKGVLTLPIYADPDFMPQMPFFNVKLYSLCLGTYERIVEAIKAMDRLIVGIMYFYTLLTSNEVVYGRMSLREMQRNFTFGTPSRDGFEHRKNCDVNVLARNLWWRG